MSSKKKYCTLILNINNTFAVSKSWAHLFFSSGSDREEEKFTKNLVRLSH